VLNKHFLKTLVLFISILAFALLAIFLISYLDHEEPNNEENVEYYIIND